MLYYGANPMSDDPDRDIWRAANLLMKQHGADAERVALGREREMEEENDLDGFLLWRRIVEAIRVLQTPLPTGLPN